MLKEHLQETLADVFVLRRVHDKAVERQFFEAKGLILFFWIVEDSFINFPFGFRVKCSRAETKFISTQKIAICYCNSFFTSFKVISKM